MTLFPGRDTDVTTAVAALLAKCRLSIPRNWILTALDYAWHDERPVVVLRHQPATHPRPGGPHASVVVDRADGTLLGWTRLDGPRPGPLPGTEEAHAAAEAFWHHVDPLHAEGLTVQWVAQHDETIGTAAGRAASVSGMRVNARHINGLYTWAVLAGDLSVLTYERDVQWDERAARRRTQMWLHDRWRAAVDGTAPAPGAPYAPARR
ncbi:hypothetical protein [Embleya sp. AB8]|uniref:hypothetical protein n=1 Tax=Embleya sp. AB8 TaxID=3156304 RepID=UPI003C76F6F2